MTLLNWALVLFLTPQLTAPGNTLPQVLSPEFKTPAKTAKAGSKTEITMAFTVTKGYAITHTPPMTLKLTAPAGIQLDKTDFTTPNKDPKSKDDYYIDLPTIKVSATAARVGTYSIPGKLTYFFCSKADGFCAKQVLDVKIPLKAE